MAPSLAPAPPVIGFATDREANRAYDRARAAKLNYRAWYKTARWRKLRETVLQRDGYQCQETGVLLIGKHPAPNAPVVDHIKRHHGDPDLFWDEANLKAVSKAWHDGEKQRLERAAEG